MFHQAEINSRLRKHMDRGQATPEDQLLQKDWPVLLEKPYEQGVYERAIGGAHAAEIDFHSLAD
jgi:hypothetical protein